MLIGPEVDTFVDANGALFSCQVSENAVGYQMLFGPDPYHVMDYHLISDTPSPPTDIITSSPFEQTWWTVKAYDQYGSTIYADPIRVNFEKIDPPLVENITSGKIYGSVRHAVSDARNGHEIVVSPGVYQGNINFRGKNLTVRSTNPDDPSVVASTIIAGDGNGNLVTFSGGEDESCVLAGFTIINTNNGIYCSGSSPTITNCSIVGNVGAGIKLYLSSNPTISNCIIADNIGSGIVMLKQVSGRKQFFNSPTITNCTIVGNSEIGISEGIPSILNSIVYDNGIQITGSSAVATYSNIQGGFPGEGNIDEDPLFADASNGDFHLLVSSPCIDTGDPNSEFTLEPEPNGGIINMGAYGGTSEASKSQ
jgi:parallel beta-helix repeat protein